MNVSLPLELENVVHAKVQAGFYGSASEVVREGLRLLLERDQYRAAQLDALRRDVAAATAQLDAGEVLSRDQVRAQVRRRRGTVVAAADEASGA